MKENYPQQAAGNKYKVIFKIEHNIKELYLYKVKQKNNV